MRHKVRQPNGRSASRRLRKTCGCARRRPQTLGCSHPGTAATSPPPDWPQMAQDAGHPRRRKPDNALATNVNDNDSFKRRAASKNLRCSGRTRPARRSPRSPPRSSTCQRSDHQRCSDHQRRWCRPPTGGSLLTCLRLFLLDLEYHVFEISGRDLMQFDKTTFSSWCLL